MNGNHQVSKKECQYYDNQDEEKKETTGNVFLHTKKDLCINKYLAPIKSPEFSPTKFTISEGTFTKLVDSPKASILRLF